MKWNFNKCFENHIILVRLVYKTVLNRFHSKQTNKQTENDTQWRRYVHYMLCAMHAMEKMRLWKEEKRAHRKGTARNLKRCAVQKIQSRLPSAQHVCAYYTCAKRIVEFRKRWCEKTEMFDKTIVQKLCTFVPSIHWPFWGPNLNGSIFLIKCVCILRERDTVFYVHHDGKCQKGSCKVNTILFQEYLAHWSISNRKRKKMVRFFVLFSSF